MTDLLAFELVLDVGGWTKPNFMATHVVDRLPYETRGMRLNEAPMDGERYSKATWFEVNFLQPNLRLPFADDFFDFVTCSQTIEDLRDPGPLMDEISRVGRRGLIECPSRMHEQTVGVRDRETSKCGHPHHHWIVESDGSCLMLYSKKDSGLDLASNRVPLTVYEDACRRGAPPIMRHEWEGSIRYTLVRGPDCETRASAFVTDLHVSPSMALKDKALRLARRLRTRMRPVKTDNTWDKVVEQSRPYMKVPLR